MISGPSLLNWVDYDEIVSKRKIGLENNQPALPNMGSGKSWPLEKCVCCNTQRPSTEQILWSKLYCSK